MAKIQGQLYGLWSGHPYASTSYKGVAQYALDAFRAECEPGGQYRLLYILEITPAEIMDRLVPGFILADEEYGIHRPQLEIAIQNEITRCCNEFCGTAGASLSIAGYAGGQIDEILLEKSLDYLIEMETIERIRTQQEYERLLVERETEVRQCFRIVRNYGKQQEPLTIERLQWMYWELVDSGKYARDQVTTTVVRTIINQAWDGLAGWVS